VAQSAAAAISTEQLNPFLALDMKCFLPGTLQMLEAQHHPDARHRAEPRLPAAGGAASHRRPQSSVQTCTSYMKLTDAGRRW
jgi:hypothetical protein